MQISVSTLDGDLVHVSLTGRMDALGADQISLPFTAAVASRQARVVVDLSDVDFVASAGLRQFFGAARAQKQRGGLMVLAAPQANVLEVLTATAVQQVIPVYESVQDALAKLRENGAS